MNDDKHVEEYFSFEASDRRSKEPGKKIKNEEKNSKKEYECEVGVEKEEKISRIQRLESKEEKEKEIQQ